MSLITRKIATFAKKVADLSDRPGGTVPTAELKAQFDSSPEELRVAFNGAMDDITSTATGASGAHQVGSANIAGVIGSNVYAQLADLKTQINQSAIGQIPDGSVGPQKLSFDPATQAEFDARNSDYEYQTPTISGTQIRLQKSSTTNRLYFKLAADLTGSITISLDGGSTSKPLRDFDGVNVATLEKGYVEVVADATFFTLRPRGGGAWVHDWSAYSTVYNLTGTTITVPTATWGTFVNITGKGFFKWCRVATTTAGTPIPDIRITVDGVAYTFDPPGNGEENHGNEVNFEIPFKQSLKIEGFNRHTISSNLLCDYLYLLQQSSPSPSKVTLLRQSQRKMVYYNTATTTLADVVNITGSGYLLGIHFMGMYASASADICGDIIIDGAQRMTNRPLVNTVSRINKLAEVVGPIRFNSSLRIRTRTDVAGSSPFVLAWYSLD